MSKEFKNLKTAFNMLDALEKELNSKKDLKRHTKIKDTFKQNFDRLYTLAYYDLKFNLANTNKLVSDLDDPNVIANRLIFIDATRFFNQYSLGNTQPFTDFENKIKSIIKRYKTKNLYICNNYLIILADKKIVKELYYDIKKMKTKSPFDFGITYIKYKKLRKTQKSFNLCLDRATKIFNGTEETGDEENDD